MSHILVTGGAGYIGSHVLAQLGERGEQVIVLDDLSTGHAKAVLYGELIVGDVGDANLLDQIFAQHAIDAVLHFAGKTVVSDSLRLPLDYYDSNTRKSWALFDACHRAGVGHVVLSSTAAVYGEVAGGIADEQTPTMPINPYGRSKLASEWMLADLALASAIRHVSLRYFNVAGCDPRGRIGQDTPQATQLIRVACEHAAGLRTHIEIFGDDYPTPDGSCVRDFIHVHDLASAHLAALDHLRAGGESLIANCGYGHGRSVLEIVRAVERISGTPLRVRMAGRRMGDGAAVISNPALIQRRLGWRPAYDDLDQIIDSTLRRERQRQRA